MNNQRYYDNMISVIDSLGFRCRIYSQIDFMDEYFTLDIVSADYRYSRWLCRQVDVRYKNINGKMRFYTVVNIQEKSYTDKESRVIMSYWESCLRLCNSLNKLNIPFVKDFEGDKGLIQYLRQGYKRINKKLVVEKEIIE